MEKHNLRLCAEYLWDGYPQAVAVLGQLQQFKRFDEIILWLMRNKIRGKDLIDFFSDAEGVETRGVLMGVKKILNYIDNDKNGLNIKDLKL